MALPAALKNRSERRNKKDSEQPSKKAMSEIEIMIDGKKVKLSDEELEQTAANLAQEADQIRGANPITPKSRGRAERVSRKPSASDRVSREGVRAATRSRTEENPIGGPIEATPPPSSGPRADDLSVMREDPSAANAFRQSQNDADARPEPTSNLQRDAMKQAMAAARARRQGGLGRMIPPTNKVSELERTMSPEDREQVDRLSEPRGPVASSSSSPQPAPPPQGGGAPTMGEMFRPGLRPRAEEQEEKLMVAASEDPVQGFTDDQQQMLEFAQLRKGLGGQAQRMLAQALGRYAMPTTDVTARTPSRRPQIR